MLIVMTPNAAAKQTSAAIARIREHGFEAHLADDGKSRLVAAGPFSPMTLGSTKRLDKSLRVAVFDQSRQRV